MDELIGDLYATTLAMQQALNDENYQELNVLLDKRNSIIAEIDKLKAENHSYSPQAIALFKEIKAIDEQVTNLLTKALATTEGLINQQRINKQVSKKFQPYSKQTSGVFFDKKK